ncbi:MAG: YjbQ family protein [Alphaproteobacteria bacterium]|nr:YjbQ family protein [Alphaproteobacteria bacterium]
MRQARTRIQIATRGKGFTALGPQIAAWVAEQGIRDGVLTVFCRHTSASLIIQENADPDVLRDLESFFLRLVREDPALYRHRDEGPDDMPAHIRAALTNASLSIPVEAGRPGLGTWQGVFLFEHRDAPHRREIALHLIGE